MNKNVGEGLVYLGRERERCTATAGGNTTNRATKTAGRELQNIESFGEETENLINRYTEIVNIKLIL